MAIVTTVTIYRGEAAALNFSAATPPVSIAGWTIKFTVARKANSTSKLIGPQDVTVLNTTTGTYRVSLVEEQTDLKPGTYFWDVWRTNEGFEQLLGAGPFVVSPDARVPPIE